MLQAEGMRGKVLACWAGGKQDRGKWRGSTVQMRVAINPFIPPPLSPSVHCYLFHSCHICWFQSPALTCPQHSSLYTPTPLSPSLPPSLSIAFFPPPPFFDNLCNFLLCCVSVCFLPPPLSPSIIHPRVHLGCAVSCRPRAIIMLGLFLTTSHYEN